MYIILARGALLSIDPGLFLWILLVFILFIFILTKYAWKPILNALQEREDSIKDSLNAAEKAMAKAEEISRENDSALREAELTAQKIRREALEEAELLRAERVEKAKEEAEQLIVQARHTIEQEKKRALTELHDEVASLAIQSVSKILDAELDEKKNKKLVDNFIKELSKN